MRFFLHSSLKYSIDLEDDLMLFDAKKRKEHDIHQ